MAFARGTTGGWSARDLAQWLLQHYEPATADTYPSVEREIPAGRPRRRSNAWCSVRARDSSRCWRHAPKTWAEASFARTMVEGMLVVGVHGANGGIGYAPVRYPEMRLVDRVVSLFVADHLTRPKRTVRYAQRSMTSRELGSFLAGVLLLGCQRAPTSTAPSDAAAVPTARVANVDTAPIASTSSTTPQPPERDVTLADDHLRVVVEPANARDFYWRADPATKFYKPAATEIASFDASLPAMLRAKVRKARFDPKPLAERAPKYMRQYVGHIDASGKRWIWGNFFCHYMGDEPQGWRKRGFGVKDGGDCYFNVEFAPDTNEFKDFMVNGEG